MERSDGRSGKQPLNPGATLIARSTPLWLPLHYNWLRGKPRRPGLDSPGGKACPTLPTGLKKRPASEDHCALLALGWLDISDKSKASVELTSLEKPFTAI